jgi:peptidoglycan-N-acetylglucosamine deacetylase
MSDARFRDAIPADVAKAIGHVRAGRRLAPKSWPGGARFAVALSFDCDHESFEIGAGGRAVGRLGWGEYGRRVGVPRILERLARHDVPASFFVPALSAMLDPDEPRRILDHGHEIGVHGWMHENNSLLDEATERDLMHRARDLLHRVTGREPVGFRSAHWDLSAHTMGIAADMGFAYDSSMMADDDCYELVIEGRPTGMVEVPVEWLRDDAVYLMFNRQPATRPWMAPDDVFAIFRRELEAAAMEGGLFQIVCHPFVIGYRSRVWMIDALIDHARALGGAWFGTHAAVAAWVRERG